MITEMITEPDVLRKAAEIIETRFQCSHRWSHRTLIGFLRRCADDLEKSYAGHK